MRSEPKRKLLNVKELSQQNIWYIAKGFSAAHTCRALLRRVTSDEVGIDDLIFNSHNLHLAMNESGMLAGRTTSPHSPNLFCLLIQPQSVYGTITLSSSCFHATYI